MNLKHERQKKIYFEKFWEANWQKNQKKIDLICAPLK